MIREAEEKDAAVLLELIRELAIYEKLEHEVITDVENLRRNLFGERKVAEALIAEKDGQAVGFALFFHSFSTFLGRPGLYLEDLFVRSKARGSGIGMALLARLAAIAQERGCGRMEWSVLDWNKPAIDIYLKLGAQPLNDWTVFRLNPAEIAALSQRDVESCRGSSAKS